MRAHVVLAGLLVSLPAWSQTVAGPPADTITVTAHRTGQELQRTGSAVTVINREQLETRQASVVADALRAVPGLAIARTGPVGAQTQLRMRGAEANQVLVLIDGVEANDLATSNEFSFEHLNSFDIDRIEVVRGPQSALWGSDALAGVVNVVTRRPREPFEADAFVEGGSDEFMNGGARLGLSSDRALLALSASRSKTDGTNAARTGDEADGYDNTTFNVTGSLALLPSLALDLSARQTDATSGFDSFGAVNGESVPVDASNSTDARQSYLRTGLRADLPGGRWSHGLHYGITETRTATESDDGFGGRDLARVDGDKYGVYYQTSLRLTQGAGDIPGHLLTLAVDHESEHFSQRGEVLDFGAPFIFDPNQDQLLRNTGYAAEYLAYFGPDLSLSASLRRDDNSDFDDVTTWRTTASWRRPDSGTRLHASLGTGQKAPTFVERYGFYANSFVGNPDLQPETSTGWDAGVEQRWLDGRITTDVTYFRTDLEDEINGFDCASFPCTASNQAGTSHRAGVELSADAELGAGYTLNAAYTYTDATQPDPQAGGEQVREVRRPLHTGSVNLAGHWLAGRLSVNLGAAYTGDREDVVALDTFVEPFSRRAMLDEYMLVSLAASYEVTRRVTLYGRVENALDEDYEDVYGFNTPGATGYVGLRVGL